MLDVRYTSRFKKDFKACVKRNYNMALLKQVIDTLRIPDKLPEKNNDHKLLGDYAGYRECHVAPNWLLIYRYSDRSLELHRQGCRKAVAPSAAWMLRKQSERPGTHADLFGI